MSRLVIVANRVPNPTDRGASAGGLAVALKDAVARRDAMWFGWSGQVVEETAAAPRITSRGRLDYAVLDLGAADHRHFYAGFSNGALWPVLHYRLGIARFSREDWAGYRRVNEAFAAALAPLLRADDVIWVHDFHLFPMAAALRALGCRQRIGFFLHVPFPPKSVWAGLPKSEALLADLSAYDVLGMQTEDDAANLRGALAAAGQGEAAGRVGAFPIGIDGPAFTQLAEKNAGKAEAKRLHDSLAGRALAIGVDRLDYTKGLPHRIAGFAQLLAHFPKQRGKVTFLQVTPVSRGEVATYRSLRRELDEAVGRINGQYAEFDWVPIRYLTRAVPRPVLAGFMRYARIGLVTPLRDGMNLVAKEFVAAQEETDPGVLVLSRFAGAANELDGAILVNPLDPDEIAEAMDAALSMPHDERLDRWARMMEGVRATHVRDWSRRFLAALEGVPEEGRAGGSLKPPAALPKPSLPRRRGREGLAQKVNRVPTSRLRPGTT